MGIPFVACSSSQKKCAVVKIATAHKAPPSTSERNSQCPRQELNLVLDLRRVVCESGTPQGLICGEPRTDQAARPGSVVGSPLTAFTIVNTKASRLCMSDGVFRQFVAVDH